MAVVCSGVTNAGSKTTPDPDSAPDGERPCPPPSAPSPSAGPSLSPSSPVRLRRTAPAENDKVAAQDRAWSADKVAQMEELVAGHSVYAGLNPIEADVADITAELLGAWEAAFEGGEVWRWTSASAPARAGCRW